MTNEIESGNQPVSSASELTAELEPASDLVSVLQGDPIVLELSDRDMDALLAAIANPPPPNAAMLRAAKRWRDLGSP